MFTTMPKTMPKTMSKTQLVRRLAANLSLLVLAVPLMAMDECKNDDAPPSGQTCEIDGVVYADGDTAPAPDGCNTCRCEGGELTECTEMGCVPPGNTCEVFGVTYDDGATNVPSPDGCNSCFCEDGQIAGCTEIACSPALPIQECDSSSTFTSDPYDLNSASIDGDVLTVDVSYAGGCAQHFFQFCYDPSFLESAPVQVNVELSHDGQDDSCEAYPSETLMFDLVPLKQAWQSSYGGSDGEMIIRLGEGILYSF